MGSQSQWRSLAAQTSECGHSDSSAANFFAACVGGSSALVHGEREERNHKGDTPLRQDWGNRMSSTPG